MRQIGALAEQCIDLTARPERLWLVNQLEAMIVATEHGATVGDSGYTRESALAARAFVQAFMAFANVPLVIDTLPDDTPIELTPLMILSARTCRKPNCYQAARDLAARIGCGSGTLFLFVTQSRKEHPSHDNEASHPSHHYSGATR